MGALWSVSPIDCRNCCSFWTIFGRNLPLRVAKKTNDLIKRQRSICTDTISNFRYGYTNCLLGIVLKMYVFDLG